MYQRRESFRLLSLHRDLLVNRGLWCLSRFYNTKIYNTLLSQILKVHYQEIHGCQSQPVLKVGSTLKVCSICHCEFKNSKTLSKHVKSVHYKLKAFSCSVCSKQFSRKATLDVSDR